MVRPLLLAVTAVPLVTAECPTGYPCAACGRCWTDEAQKISGGCSDPCAGPAPTPAPQPMPTPVPTPAPGGKVFQLSNFGTRTGNGFIVVDCNELATTRLDPILSPGHCFEHVHTVFGSQVFGSVLSLDDMTLGDELAGTTCDVPADGSIYWAPTLYYHSNGQYHSVSATLAAYYFNDDGSSGAANSDLVPMPPGLRMIRGNPHHVGPLTGNGLFDFGAKGGDPSWWGGPGSPTASGGMPRDLERYWQANFVFPSCWDGQTRADGKVWNVKFPNGNNCPEGYRYRIPKMLMEVRYYVGDVSGVAPGDFKLGMGVSEDADSKGYGAHVDFVAGWNPEFLDASLKTSSCHGTPFSSDDESCPVYQFINIQRSFTPEMNKPQPDENAEAVDGSVFPLHEDCIISAEAPKRHIYNDGSNFRGGAIV